MEKKYGPYDAPYWKRRWKREEDAKKSESAYRIDYALVVAAAREWIDAENTFQRGWHGKYISPGCNKDGYRLYKTAEALQRTLWTVCMATGIKEDAAVKAARIEYRYYEDHNGSLLVDYEKLIHTLS